MRRSDTLSEPCLLHGGNAKKLYIVSITALPSILPYSRTSRFNSTLYYNVIVIKLLCITIEIYDYSINKCHRRMHTSKHDILIQPLVIVLSLRKCHKSNTIYCIHTECLYGSFVTHDLFGHLTHATERTAARPRLLHEAATLAGPQDVGARNEAQQYSNICPFYRSSLHIIQTLNNNQMTT